MQGSVLIIDDEEQLRKLLTRIITLEGFSVLEASTLKSGSQVLTKSTVDVILCDVRLPDGNGVDFVKTLKKNYPSAEIILLTAYGNIGDGVQAIKNGAFDYIVKGDDNDRLIPLLYQALDKSILYKRSAVTINEKTAADFTAIIGKSPAIKSAINVARKAAQTDASILLLGETGTGKEVFANAIHQASGRKNHPMVSINCSAFNKELLESELFGHKAGAYTGAHRDKKGLVEVAHKGTLFLDEIGELDAGLQAKLLRFLENGEFIKIGDDKISKADVRIIAATNRHLKEEVEQKHFREDLYYRLNVVSIELPSLRERTEDIPLLAHYFLSRFSGKDNKLPAAINNEVVRLMEGYSWRGNIRELKNVLERAIVLGGEKEILPEHLPFELQQQSTGSHRLSLAEVENHHIRKILAHTNGNKTKAAQLLEIGLATLYRKMQEYGISK